MTITLQSRKVGGVWTPRATGQKVVYSGGGSANRAAARAVCANLVEKVEWRSMIDVDLVGYDDAPTKTYSPVASLYCG
ncbi:hypothetical protein [Cellulomonas chitinilytica]|uniref:hypothetical protein n=1 Tax=Cellulomonas chitinilytica TaxID=398759 RepID=UPI00194497DF|nr:hypothetical protein [Cellulomonas chitinilytica]